jgi:hypothetical protein
MFNDALKMLTTLFATVSIGLIELRPIRPGGAAMPTFYPVAQIERVAARAIDLRDHADVYFGVAPRAEEASGKAAIACVQVVWVDLDPDSPGSLIDILSFPLTPSIVVSSGRGYHVYWVLTEPIDVPRAELLNRGLAEHFGTDVRVRNADRILRVPGTINHKDGSEVRLLDCTDARYSAADIEAQLPKPTARRTRPTASPQSIGPNGAGETPFERFISLIDVVSDTGSWIKARCPAHEDNTPSLSVKEGRDGRVIVKCHAGCQRDQIITAVGLDPADLEPARSGRRSQASDLIDLAHDRQLELFHGRQHRGFARVPVHAHRETWPLDSAGFKRWLMGEHYRETGEAARAQSVADAVATLTAEALSDGPCLEVHYRVAGDLDVMWIDLGDDTWRAIEITPGAWGIVDDPPVPFVRSAGALALPEPERGGHIDELRRLTNLPDDESWTLVRGFLLSILHPVGPYAVGLFTGDPGSAKTWLAWIISQLTDPFIGQFSTGTPGVRDLMASAMSSWLIGQDNVSNLPRKVSDALCQITSGAGVRERLYFTNGDLFVGEARRPAVITAIGDVIERPDLVDRLVAPNRLHTIPPEDRRDEQDMLREFNAVKGRVFGGMLDALAAALEHLPQVQLERLPRLASIARFVTAAERGLGLNGEFAEALMGTQTRALVRTVDSSPVVAALVAFMEDLAQPTWEDSATTLHNALTEQVGEMGSRTRDWPKRPADMMREFNEQNLVIHAAGLTVESGRHPGGTRARFVRVSRIDRDAGTTGGD